MPRKIRRVRIKATNEMHPDPITMGNGAHHQKHPIPSRWATVPITRSTDALTKGEPAFRGSSDASIDDRELHHDKRACP
jgi:hypothetical protein